MTDSDIEEYVDGKCAENKYLFLIFQFNYVPDIEKIIKLKRGRGREASIRGAEIMNSPLVITDQFGHNNKFDELIYDIKIYEFANVTNEELRSFNIMANK